MPRQHGNHTRSRRYQVSGYSSAAIQQPRVWCLDFWVRYSDELALRKDQSQGPGPGNVQSQPSLRDAVNHYRKEGRRGGEYQQHTEYQQDLLLERWRRTAGSITWSSEDWWRDLILPSWYPFLFVKSQCFLWPFLSWKDIFVTARYRSILGDLILALTLLSYILGEYWLLSRGFLFLWLSRMEDACITLSLEIHCNTVFSFPHHSQGGNILSLSLSCWNPIPGLNILLVLFSYKAGILAHRNWGCMLLREEHFS